MNIVRTIKTEADLREFAEAVAASPTDVVPTAATPGGSWPTEAVYTEHTFDDSGVTTTEHTIEFDAESGTYGGWNV